MSNSSNRRASTPPSGGEVPVRMKRDLTDALAVEGWAMFTLPPSLAKGDCTRTVEFRAVKGTEMFVLDRVPVGDPRDWAGMWEAFKNREATT